MLVAAVYASHSCMNAFRDTCVRGTAARIDAQQSGLVSKWREILLTLPYSG